MDIIEVEKMVIKLIAKYLPDWSFEWEKKKTGVFGICYYHKKQIRLSFEYTLHDSNMKRIHNTILHEIAHGLDFIERGKTNHDKHWKKIAKSIGCTGTANGDTSTLNKEMIYKWKGVCENDHVSYHYIKFDAECKCGKCGKFKQAHPTEKLNKLMRL